MQRPGLVYINLVILNPYADYIFISPEIELKNFNVLPDEVSDHAHYI